MDWFQGLVLAAIQGVTEFLPISSSAHLILTPQLLGWPDQGLAFDVAVHVGTLLAVLLYFRKELSKITVDWLYSLQGRGQTEYSRLAWSIGFSTIPVGLAGLLLKHWVEQSLRSHLVIVVTTISFGLLLGFAAWCSSQKRTELALNWKDVLAIGGAQALALIPGTSRSGITITAGLLMGFSQEAAARYSFLLAIPVIVLAGGLEGISLLKKGIDAPWQPMLWATVTSGVIAYGCIHYFLRFINKIGVLPFVIYRLLLGVFLLYALGFKGI